MNVQALHQFIAMVPGTFGDGISRRMAVNMVAAGSVNHAAALVGLTGPNAIPALIEAGAPPAMLQAAIEYAVLHRHHELRGIDRAAFAAWCRRAEFQGPADLPETISLYRGTMGCSPADAAMGLHWSLSFDDAAYYACRFADVDLTGVVVLHACVLRDGIAAFISGNAHQEVVPLEMPAVFEAITEKVRIGDAAVRNAHRCEALRAQGGWFEASSAGIAETNARRTRARMAAAGVKPGTAIVA